jgi:hypothetical protein
VFSPELSRLTFTRLPIYGTGSSILRAYQTIRWVPRPSLDETVDVLSE